MLKLTTEKFDILLDYAYNKEINEDATIPGQIMPNTPTNLAQKQQSFMYNFGDAAQKFLNPNSPEQNTSKDTNDANNKINQEANLAIQGTKVPIKPMDYTRYIRNSVLGAKTLIPAMGVKSVADFMMQIRRTNPQLEQFIAQTVYSNDAQKLSDLSKYLKQKYYENPKNISLTKTVGNAIKNTATNLMKNYGGNMQQPITSSLEYNIDGLNYMMENIMTVEKSLKHEDKLGEGAKKRKKLKNNKDKAEAIMKEFKKRTLRSGSGKKVTNRKQALAILASETGIARKKK